MKHKLLPCIIGIAILISAVLQGQGGSRTSSPLITNMEALATLRQNSDVLPYLAFDLITDIGAHIAKHREIKAQAPQVKILRYISANAWQGIPLEGQFINIALRRDEVYSGHWLFYAGSRLKEDVSATQTSVPLLPPAPFCGKGDEMTAIKGVPANARF